MVPLHLLECVPEQIRHIPKYVGDHLIRHYIDKTISDLLRDCELPNVDNFVIVGGIGELTMSRSGNTFVRAGSAKMKIASTSEKNARLHICMSCDSYKEERCSSAGCGCAMEGKIEIWSSKCPLDKWPHLTVL
jgi:hypothetical protein